MKKKVTLKNGTVKLLEFNEKFINSYMGIGINTMMQYKRATSGIGDCSITDDDKQNIALTMLEAFNEYNGDSKFSTFFTWKMMGFCSKEISYNTAQKRDGSQYEILSLDCRFNDKNGQSNSLKDVIADNNVNIEEIFEKKDLIEHLYKNTKDEFEKYLLLINLGEIKPSIVSDITGVSRQSITQRNKTFKKRLKTIIEKYNELKEGKK